LFAPAHAQQPGDHGFQHGRNHDWYKDLKQPGTAASCCNGDSPEKEGDCRPTRAFRIVEGQRCGGYPALPGQWCAFIDGFWTPIPFSRVLTSDNSKEPYIAHVCASRSGVIYCFIEKEGGT